MLQQMTAPETRATTMTIGTPATYGTLMDAVRSDLDHAIAISHARQPSPDAALNELRGYERFLHTAGRHLLLLIGVTGFHVPQTRQLAERLRVVPFRDDLEPGSWSKAAATLGAAHDLVATHASHHTARTTEGEEQLIGIGSVLASQQVTALVLEAADARTYLIRHALHSQYETTEKPISYNTTHRVREAAEAAALRGSAAMWELHNALAGSTGPTLDALQPAVAVSDLTPPSKQFVNSLTALRALRELSRRQAHGELAASPASLRDLALLGARVTDPALLAEPWPDGGLDRVRRAHLEDQLDVAHDAWMAAAADLTRTIQGITKAPAGYAAAVNHLLEIDNSAPEFALRSPQPCHDSDAKPPRPLSTWCSAPTC